MICKSKIPICYQNAGCFFQEISTYRIVCVAALNKRHTHMLHFKEVSCRIRQAERLPALLGWGLSVPAMVVNGYQPPAGATIILRSCGAAVLAICCNSSGVRGWIG